MLWSGSRCSGVECKVPVCLGSVGHSLHLRRLLVEFDFVCVVSIE